MMIKNRDWAHLVPNIIYKHGGTLSSSKPINIPSEAADLKYNQDTMAQREREQNQTLHFFFRSLMKKKKRAIKGYTR